MNTALWIVQFFLAAVFVGQGAIKFSPPPNLPLMLHWVIDLHHSSPGLSAFIGVSELLGAVGLVLPGVIKWQLRLTPLAAFGLAIAMSLAAVYHLQRGEMANIGINAMLFVLTAFVMWGRGLGIRAGRTRVRLGRVILLNDQ
jgi:putative oxidoreductase